MNCSQHCKHGVLCLCAINVNDHVEQSVNGAEVFVNHHIQGDTSFSTALVTSTLKTVKLFCQMTDETDLIVTNFGFGFH